MGCSQIIFKIRIAYKADADHLTGYYHKLSDLSKQRFAPHDFSNDYLLNNILDHPDYIALIAEDADTKEVIGYAVCQLYLFDYDVERWSNYDRHLIGIDFPKKYACFAPSVLDALQHAGIGSQLLKHTMQLLIKVGYTHILLWGGVKCDNINAVQFYLKNGFEIIGHFDYQGGNYDMLLRIG